MSGNILEKIPGLSQLISLSTHLIESLVNVITSQIKCIRIDMKEWQAKSTTVIPFSKGKTEFPALEKMLEDDIKKRTSKKK